MADRDSIKYLLRQAKKNDPVALTKIYHQFIDQIYGYVYYKVGNREDAEDLSQEVFLNAFKAIRKYVWRGIPFSAWLFRIAHNLVVNYYISQKRTMALSFDDESSLDKIEENPSELAELETERENLRKAMAKLPEEQQQVVILKFFLNRTNIEISSFLNKSEGAIKSMQYRALKNLKHILTGEISNE